MSLLRPGVIKKQKPNLKQGSKPLHNVQHCPESSYLGTCTVLYSWTPVLLCTLGHLYCFVLFGHLYCFVLLDTCIALYSWTPVLFCTLWAPVLFCTLGHLYCFVLFGHLYCFVLFGHLYCFVLLFCSLYLHISNLL